MSYTSPEFLKTLRATFKVEAAEHLQVIANGLLELEKTPASGEHAKLIADIFRAAHSLKGAARATDFTEIESLCQAMEDKFAAWKRGDSAPTLDSLDALHRSLNAITSALEPKNTAPGIPSSAPSSYQRPVSTPSEKPATATTAGSGSAFPSTETKNPHETVRITVGKLDTLLVEAEEMLMAKLTAGQRAGDLRKLGQSLEAWRNEYSLVEPEVRALRQSSARSPAGTGLGRLLEFFDWQREQLKALEGKVAILARTAEQDRHAVGKLVDDLLGNSKKLLLLPFGTLAAPFPKLVRDLCRDQGKEADLVIRGEDVEVDKRVLEEMKDPLIHLLRNCVDHGVENPDVRIRQGKSPRATITLTVAPVNGSKVEFFVSDDGTGIDTEKVRASAVKQGYLSDEAARQLSEAEARRLIFQSEVSTSPLVTKLSGRGLGLAIVREKAEKLGGHATVESQPGRGSQFQILVPSTLATFRGVLLETAGRRFIVPTFHVERVARVRINQVQTVEGRETVTLDGRITALVRLDRVLDLPGGQPMPESATISLIVLGLGDERIAFAVDTILDEHEVLVKPLHKPLVRVRNIAGATVLGSGQVAPVINVADLLKSARSSGTAAPGTPIPAAKATRHAHSVLIAEDSITSRMMLKGILESAGYRVKTAVDGLEAFTLLRTEKFDLLVSDVEMPRLGGLDLTARIRSDPKLAELPVVLVTTLETREDRERGVEVGASAYIIKSRFNQSDLLDAIRRLI